MRELIALPGVLLSVLIPKRILRVILISFSRYYKKREGGYTCPLVIFFPFCYVTRFCNLLHEQEGETLSFIFLPAEFFRRYSGGLHSGLCSVPFTYSFFFFLVIVNRVCFYPVKGRESYNIFDISKNTKPSLAAVAFRIFVNYLTFSLSVFYTIRFEIKRASLHSFAAENASFSRKFHVSRGILWGAELRAFTVAITLFSRGGQ